MPSELIDDADWEKALEWNGEENMENTNLNMEEIEEIILGIFKTNLSKNAIRSPKQNARDITHHNNDDKKIKVFETIKEPKNYLKKKQNRIHLQNQIKRDIQMNNGINNLPDNNMNNHNILNYNLMNQLGFHDPHLQMVLGNTILPNGLNLNLLNHPMNMGKNSNNFGNPMGWEQLMTGMNMGFPGPIPTTSNKKEDMMNKNNMIENNLLSYLMNSNQNFMDMNNDDMLRNLLKANNGVNMGNMSNIMGLIGNPNPLMANDSQSIDNMNMFNDLILNLFNPTMNSRGGMPLNEMMMQMFPNCQGDLGANSSKFPVGNNNMNTGHIYRDTNPLSNLLTSSNNINTSSSEKNNDPTPCNQNNHLVTSGNTLNQGSDLKNQLCPNTIDEVSDNNGDISKLQSFNNDLANAIKMLNKTGNTNNSDLISNIPELFSNNIANLQKSGNYNGLENDQLQNSASNLKDANKDGNVNTKLETIENMNLISPSNPNENLLTDDVSMMLLNFLNSSNPQLPHGYDLSSFSHLFDLQNMNNTASHNNINNSLNCGNSIKKQDSASIVDVVQEDKEKEESIQNKTHISSNHNINNNMSFNNGVNKINNNLFNNNFIGPNVDYGINPNVFQQTPLNNFLGDPILGLMNQFFIQPNNLMPTSNNNNLPLFNSKNQIDNYFLNNFNQMDMYFDQNMINQSNNQNPSNMKNNSEK